ncbi:MAG: NAD(P)-dependent alcohol dehydrogenase [Verrucomicrobiota bacterium JB023]|nr:NAD(P)-dependent alcohol dehydrogenase [Verrucomicrobiota bacterium JB023]
MKVYGYGTKSKEDELVPVTFERGELRDGEVAIQITHCGVCHSDLHQAKNDWGNTIYPCVPGHEIAGVVTEVGPGVTRYAKGDRVGVGCMVNSCQECDSCEKDEEQYCSGPKSCTLTYNGPKNPDGSNTYGGYSTDIIVREEFVLRVPDEIEQDKVGPILCAGITVYAPMKHFELKEGQTLGVAGIGGLGHMAVKLGKALGAKVVAFTRNEDKKEEILAMGADEVVISTDEEQMNDAAGSLDMLINTIPVAHDIAPYIQLMRPNSHLVIVGNMDSFPEFSPGPLVFNRISLSGSLIGGIADTQEVLVLCAKHGIAPATKLVSIDAINEVYEELANGGGQDFRHVIDLDTLRKLEEDSQLEATELPSPERGDLAKAS